MSNLLGFIIPHNILVQIRIKLNKCKRNTDTFEFWECHSPCNPVEYVAQFIYTQFFMFLGIKHILKTDKETC